MKLRLAEEEKKQFGWGTNAENKHFLMNKITFIVLKKKPLSADEISFLVGDEYYLWNIPIK